MNKNIREIKGNWDKGYVLDKHVLRSVYIGDSEYGRPQFDTTRSEVGEALYRLKYKKEWAQAASLANEIAVNLLPLFGKVDFIVPMPASIFRTWQPVSEIAKALGQTLSVPVIEDLITKVPAPDGQTQLKNLTTKEEKVAALTGRFVLKDTITNEGHWNALLVDDLYDTGASMEAACAMLRTYRKIARIYVVALTWK